MKNHEDLKSSQGMIGPEVHQIRRYSDRVLRRYGYPPDKQEKATQTVLEQAEVLCEHWAA